METKLCLIFGRYLVPEKKMVQGRIFGRYLAPEKNSTQQNKDFVPATQLGKNMHGIFLKDSTILISHALFAWFIN